MLKRHCARPPKGKAPGGVPPPHYKNYENAVLELRRTRMPLRLQGPGTLSLMIEFCLARTLEPSDEKGNPRPAQREHVPQIFHRRGNAPTDGRDEWLSCARSSLSCMRVQRINYSRLDYGMAAAYTHASDSMRAMFFSLERSRGSSPTTTRPSPVDWTRSVRRPRYWG